MMIPILLLLFAYLLGGVPFGYLLVRLKTGEDVRSMGSGNIGATNVLRTTGRIIAVTTLLLDIAKGSLAVWLMGRITGGDVTWMSLAAVAVMLGHAFPVFLKFQGGKAVASFIGAYLVLAPWPLLACLIIFVVVVWLTRFISLGSILAAGLFPLAVWMIEHPPLPVVLAALFSGAFIVWRHRSNIERLRAGTEHVFTFGGKEGVKRLAVVGGGSWGTALAIILAPRFERVRLWVFEHDLAERMRTRRENDIYLSGFRLPENVDAGDSLPWTAEAADVVLSVTPSHHTRRIFEQLRDSVDSSMLFVSATKGLEGGSLLRMTEVIAEVLRPKFEPRVGALSGPTFAREVAGGEPAAIVIASLDASLARAVQMAFAGPTFRLYTNPDPIGVEIGAALKNVIAIAAGVCAGMGLGSNTTAALITRGLAEITRLAAAAGGQGRTLAGLAGLGDLVLTCNGEQSRNRTVGFRLGRGETIDQILASMNMVAEGVKTTFAAMELAAKLQVELPIARQMRAILHGERTPKDAVRELMERSLKEE